MEILLTSVQPLQRMQYQFIKEKIKTNKHFMIFLTESDYKGDRIFEFNIQKTILEQVFETSIIKNKLSIHILPIDKFQIQENISEYIYYNTISKLNKENIKNEIKIFINEKSYLLTGTNIKDYKNMKIYPIKLKHDCNKKMTELLCNTEINETNEKHMLKKFPQYVLKHKTVFEDMFHLYTQKKEKRRKNE